MRWRPGCTPEPARGAYGAPPGPLAGLRKRWRKWEGIGNRGKGREREKEGGEGGVSAPRSASCLGYKPTSAEKAQQCLLLRRPTMTQGILLL